MRDLMMDAATCAVEYLEGINSRPVAPSTQAVEMLSSFDGPLPELPSDPAAVLELLDTLGSPGTMAMQSPRYFGFVIGGTLPAALAANWLAGAWDQTSSLYRVTPSTAHIEQVALRWLTELFGLPNGAGAAFTTGATMANFSALAAARNRVLDQAGWNVESDGLIGAPPVTIIVGDEVHPTLIKGLGLLGFGRNRVVRVPVDNQGRMRTERIPAISGPTIVCTQVGNVNTGACDPVSEICDLVQTPGAWVHVDGAFGLWALASPHYAHLVAGIQKADSWATDAHKWLNVPYDSGIAFVRHCDALRSAMAITAEYLPTESLERNPSDFTPELSRRARGVEIWAALRSLGRQGVAELVERCCGHAQRFADGLRAAGYTILNQVVLNQVLVSFGDSESTERVTQAVQEEGTCWCGRTEWQGHTAMRISVSNWATTEADVKRSLEAIIKEARSVEPLS